MFQSKPRTWHETLADDCVWLSRIVATLTSLVRGPADKINKRKTKNPVKYARNRGAYRGVELSLSSPKSFVSRARHKHTVPRVLILGHKIIIHASGRLADGCRPDEYSTCSQLDGSNKALPFITNISPRQRILLLWRPIVFVLYCPGIKTTGCENLI